MNIVSLTEEILEAQPLEDVPEGEEAPVKPHTMPDAEQLDFRAALKTQVWVKVWYWKEMYKNRYK